MTRVELTAQGRLLKVKCYNGDAEWIPPGKRGNVETFSEQSRMRMLRKLARLSPSARDGFRHRCSFLTLTTRGIYHPRQIKEWMRAFLKRMARKWSSVSAVWRLEYQKRGAPHLHLVIYNVPYIPKDGIQAAWGEIVGEDRPFTRIESIRSYKHLMSYVSKYAAKVQEGGFNTAAYQAANPESAYADESPGRVWGMFNRKNLPWAIEEVAELPQSFAWYSLRKYCMGHWPWIWDSETAGFTVFCDDPYHALAHLQRMYKVYDSYKLPI